jgi:hypothetical protein
VRDAEVYEAELRLFERIALEESELLLEVAKEAAWADCMELAEPALVAKVRAPYHASKALFLAGLGEDPGAAPEIPSARSVCGDPTVEDVHVPPGDHDHLVIEHEP